VYPPGICAVNVPLDVSEVDVDLPLGAVVVVVDVVVVVVEVVGDPHAASPTAELANNMSPTRTLNGIRFIAQPPTGCL